MLRCAMCGAGGVVGVGDEEQGWVAVQGHGMAVVVVAAAAASSRQRRQRQYAVAAGGIRRRSRAHR